MTFVCRRVCRQWRAIVPRLRFPSKGRHFAYATARLGMLGLFQWTRQGNLCKLVPKEQWTGAAKSGNLEMLKFLLSFPVSKEREEWKESLHAAAKGAASVGNLDVINLLFGDLKVNGIKDYEEVCIAAIRKDHEHVASWLILNLPNLDGPKKNKRNKKFFLKLVMNGCSLAFVEFFMDKMPWFKQWFFAEWKTWETLDFLNSESCKRIKVDVLKWISRTTTFEIIPVSDDMGKSNVYIANWMINDSGVIADGADIFFQAYRAGNLPLLRWARGIYFPITIPRNYPRKLKRIPNENSVPTLKFMVEEWGGVLQPSLYVSAVMKADVDALNYLKSIGLDINEVELGIEWDAIHSGGRLKETVHWLKLNYANFLETASGRKLLIAYGRLNDIQSAVEENGLQINRGLLKTALQFGRFRVFSYFVSIGVRIPSEILKNVLSTRNAAQWGDFKMLRLLVSLRFAIDSSAFKAASSLNFRSLRMDMCRYLASIKCPMSVEVFQNAVKVGDMEMMTWLKEIGCPWDTGASHTAALLGRLDCLEWLKTNGCPWNVSTLLPSLTGRDRKHIVTWIQEWLQKHPTGK